jgi:predicted GNAT family acetyltransferase
LLIEADRPAIETLCEQQREFNIFFLANLDKLSSEQDLVQCWGQFDNTGHVVGVLMRYRVLWYIYDKPRTDLRAFAGVIELKAQPSIIVNDNVRTAPSLVPLLKNYWVELDLAARLRRLHIEHFVELAQYHSVRRATLEDVERLAQFYAQAPEDVHRGPDSIRRSIGEGRRTFLVEINGEIVASALTTAELPTLAMIGGLHIPPQLRDREYLMSAMAALVRSLLDEGKRACVVVRDPLVAATCDQLGFDDVGPWRIVHMRRCEV